jgi:hypothetical protein
MDSGFREIVRRGRIASNNAGYWDGLKMLRIGVSAVRVAIG